METFEELQSAYQEAEQDNLYRPSREHQERLLDAEWHMEKHLNRIAALKEVFFEFIEQYHLGEQTCVMVPMGLEYHSMEVDFWRMALDVAYQLAGRPSFKQWIQ